jgi:CDP-glucose 4,6-dehydratase
MKADDLRLAFANKRVLITGHTGFKGSWLAMVLKFLDAKVYGYSLDIPTSPSIFANLDNVIEETTWGDIVDREKLVAIVETLKPDFVFHLAAQPLVSRSYEDPLYTAMTNTMGTLTLADTLMSANQNVTVVFITSDKCYENVEQVWGYRESDRLGGADLYSASKAAAEILINSFHRSFFLSGGVKIATARAGNVIGGGDWSRDRIVPDIMLSHQLGAPIHLRSPNSTRPWQHVLEPVVGYLLLAMNLSNGTVERGESYNFGPSSKPKTVHQLVAEMQLHMPDLVVSDSYVGPSFHEAGLLSLSWEKANAHFGWAPVLSFEDTVRLTVDWYREFYLGTPALEISHQQISLYFEKLGG